MSEDDGLRFERRQRIPALVAQWADHDVSDPGVTLLEVLAFAADALGYYADRAGDEAYLGSTSGRIHRADGLRRAVVVDVDDPTGRRRLKVRLTGAGSDEAWAAACLSPGDVGPGPEPGTAVWVAFEEADPSRPVWLGVAVDEPTESAG